MTDLLKVQEQLEKDMVARGRARFEAIRRKAETSDDALRSRSYRVVLEAALEPLEQGISKFLADSVERRAGRRVRSALFMASLDPAALAYIVLATVITASPRGAVPLVGLAERVGRAVEVEAHFAALEITSPGLAHFQKEIIKGSSTNHHRQIVAKVFTGGAERAGEKEEWAVSDRVSVGVKLIELLIQTTGLFRIHRARAKTKTTDHVAPSEGFRAWVEDLSSTLSGMFPTWMPMVVPPKDWTGLNSGGYLTDAFPVPPSFVKTSDRAHLAILEQADLSRVMSAVNAIQRTPWQINVAVLEVAEALVQQGRPVAGLPDMDKEPIPTPPLDFDADPVATKAWKREAAGAYERNAKALHKRLQVLNAVSMAREFAQREEIFFPHQCDFRGRIYPIPTQLSPQGTDLHKGLLRFAHGHPLETEEGARWFEIHGANCWGIDKVPFYERQVWVAENAPRIIESANSPLDETWWMEADSPFQFLAWCFEYAAWRAGGFDLSFVSRVPVAMDGSCNGIQHYSAMLLDPRGGKATNLIPSEAPQDLYGEVAAVVMRVLRERSKSSCADPDEARMVREWVNYGVDRSICKPAVIGFSFGGTPDGAYRGILKHVEEQPASRQPAGDKAAACRFIAQIVWEAIKIVAKGASEAMRWLRAVAKERGGALTWTAPSGFVVYQRQPKRTKKQIKLVMFGKRLQPVLLADTGEIDVRKQLDAFPPNYVHSMDAACLALTVNAASLQSLAQFAMIHDSYGCPAGQAPTLASILRDEFVKVYERGPLGALYRDLGGDPSSPLRNPPIIGGLNLSDIRKSDYFFA